MKCPFWSWEHDRCRRCNRSDRPHRARGLCVNCYYSVRYRKNARYREGAKTRAAWSYWARKVGAVNVSGGAR